MKYLIFRLPSSSYAGLDHLLAEFKGAIREAVNLGRILVIEKQFVAAQHNLGYELENLEIGRYINLEKTQVYRIEENGSVLQITSSFRYIHAEDFNIDDYPEEQVLHTANIIKPITKEQDEQYKVIIRTTDEYYYPKLYLNFLISLYPSDEVARLTDIVLKAMGTSLADAKRLEAIYQGIDFSVNRDIFQQKMLDNPLYYVCLHVRGNDMLRDLEFKFGSNRLNLSSIIERMIPKDSRIYIMSDIQQRDYFDFLKEDYIVYQYHDFPELKALVSGDNGKQVDNTMLYSVEKNIFQYASVKMIRSNKSPKLIYTNVTHEIPIWYKFYQYCRLKKRDMLKRYYHNK